jgi:hypothetical protein
MGRRYSTGQVSRDFLLIVVEGDAALVNACAALGNALGVLVAPFPYEDVATKAMRLGPFAVVLPRSTYREHQDEIEAVTAGVGSVAVPIDVAPVDELLLKNRVVDAMNESMKLGIKIPVKRD